MITPPPGSYNRSNQYYLDLFDGTCDPTEIINDINFYKKQLDEVQKEHDQKLEELKSYRLKVEQLERTITQQSKDMNELHRILSSLAVCLAKNKNIKIQKEEQ